MVRLCDEANICSITIIVIYLGITQIRRPNNKAKRAPALLKGAAH